MGKYRPFFRRGVWLGVQAAIDMRFTVQPLTWYGLCLYVICVETLHRKDKSECEYDASYPVHGAPLGTDFSEHISVRLGGAEQNFIPGIKIGKGQGVRQHREQERQSEIQPYLPSGLPTSNQSG